MQLICFFPFPVYLRCYMRKIYHVKHDSFPVSEPENLRLTFIISLCYSLFLRVSEADNLLKRDITLQEAEERMDVTIRFSKTDQMGVGETCYVFKTQSPSSPWVYLAALNGLQDDEKICQQSVHGMRQHLKAVLQVIGVPDPDSYSFHSFRRGAAFHASNQGVPDSMIKKHDRWRSEAYVRYVQVDAIRAGREVSDAQA